MPTRHETRRLHRRVSGGRTAAHPACEEEAHGTDGVRDHDHPGERRALERLGETRQAIHSIRPSRARRPGRSACRSSLANTFL